MFKLSIVTPEKVFYEADVRSLVVPGTDGYLGILTSHAPLITALKPGKIEFIDDDGKQHIMAVTSGFLEVSHNMATLLADAAEDESEINIDRAKAAYEKAWEQLKAAGRGEIDVDMNEARAALERASNRIKIYEQTH